MHLEGSSGVEEDRNRATERSTNCIASDTCSYEYSLCIGSDSFKILHRKQVIAPVHASQHFVDLHLSTTSKFYVVLAASGKHDKTIPSLH
jgi:hypothetical protein